MTYNAVALSDSLEKGRVAGTVQITTNSLAFTFSSGEVKMPLRDIEITGGGSGNHLIYFRHTAVPGWCISCSDKKILDNPNLSNLQVSHKSVAKVKSSQRLVVYVIAGIIAFSFLTIAGIFVFRNTIIHSIAGTVPVEWEQQAGEQIFATIKMQKTLVGDSVLNKKINELGSIITNTVPDKKFRFKFHIVKDSSLNAFALPGGNVVIHSGLIMRAESPEEILGVLGHEVAHVTERHHVRGLITKMGLRYLILLFFDTGSAIGDLIINAGSTLQSLKYDRDLETEADEKGWEYVTKANVNPAGMISFFKKLEGEKKGTLKELEASLDWMNTHPNTAERIERLEKKYKKTGKRHYNSAYFDLKTFKTQLKAKL
jgi:beta-barrel assembly-enhancing protease